MLHFRHETCGFSLLNHVSANKNTFSSGLSTMLSAFSGNVGGTVSGVQSMATGTVNNLVNTVHSAADLGIDIWTRSKCPGLSKGTPHTPSLNLIYRNIGFTIKQMAIRPEIAKSIDDYFDMYGYATNKLKYFLSIYYFKTLT